MAQPRTIHDFFARVPKLDNIQYPAPGLPELAEQVAEVVKPRWVGQDFDAWGLDHGTWSVLAHMFPAADVPVVQLSINATKPWDYHLELGARLAPLRRHGVLIVGSGNVVHNLRKVRPAMAEAGFDWAQRFDEHARAVMLDDPTEVAASPLTPTSPPPCRPRTTSSPCSTSPAWPATPPARRTCSSTATPPARCP